MNIVRCSLFLCVLIHRKGTSLSPPKLPTGLSPTSFALTYGIDVRNGHITNGMLQTLGLVPVFLHCTKERQMLANSNVTPILSPNYTELHGLFKSFNPPHEEQDVRAFSAAYRRIYPTLAREERKRAEWLVDLMIERIERKELAELIYGVF